jgi:hypothetical protein
MESDTDSKFNYWHLEVKNKNIYTYGIRITCYRSPYQLLIFGNGICIKVVKLNNDSQNYPPIVIYSILIYGGVFQLELIMKEIFCL